MTSEHIAYHRLVNQQLAGTKIKTPKEMVGHFGAMQAQDYAMAKWAVGTRLSVTEQVIDKALHAGDIVRTHVLRPTWHFVSKDDIRWMLELTAPHVKKLITPMCKKHELDEKVLGRYNERIEKLLSGNKHLTREEIMCELNVKTTSATDFRPVLIAMHAELEGLICNGVIRGKTHTYALLSERTPVSKKLTKEEGLAKLASIYFKSHGPATAQDFAWWSGLSVANTKLAIELIKPDFDSVEINQQTYFSKPIIYNTKTDLNKVYFLPAFDEFLIGYKDRTGSIPLKYQPKVFTRNGIFKPVLVVSGQVIGTWSRTLKKDFISIEKQLFKSVSKAAKQSIFNAANKYGNYLNMKVSIT
jgi:hypothetical protein